jgi:hypothetical protein
MFSRDPALEPSRRQKLVFAGAVLAIAAPLTQVPWAGHVPAAMWEQSRIVVSPLGMDLFAGLFGACILQSRGILAAALHALTWLADRARQIRVSDGGWVDW